MMDSTHLSRDYHRCLDSWSLCAALCLRMREFFPAQAEMQDVCLLDCARACQHALHLVGRGLMVQASLCEVSACICDRVARQRLPEGAGDLGQLMREACSEAAAAFRWLAGSAHAAREVA